MLTSLLGFGNSDRIPTSTLALQLHLYHVRMFPVWPVVRVEELITALERDPEANELEAYALTTVVAATTIVQLQLKENNGSNILVKASDMANECEKARDLLSYR